MYHLRVPVFLLTAFVLLRCIAAAPSHSPGSSSDDEKENSLVDKESRALPELISDLFIGLKGSRPERQVVITKSPELTKHYHLGTCELMNMVSMMRCLSGRHGLKKKLEYLNKGGKRTDVGPTSFGKRDTHQPPALCPSSTNWENTPVTS